VRAGSGCKLDPRAIDPQGRRKAVHQVVHQNPVGPLVGAGVGHVLAWHGHPASDMNVDSGHCPIAVYDSFFLRMVASNPDIFEPFDDVRSGESDTFQNTTVEPQGSLSYEKCQTCNRRRNRRGIGSVFCHACSGVDSSPLPDHALHPCLARKRLQIIMQEKLVAEEIERIEQERQEAEEKLMQEHAAREAAANVLKMQKDKSNKKGHRR